MEQLGLSRPRTAADRNRRADARGDIADCPNQPLRLCGGALGALCAVGAPGSRVGGRSPAVRGRGKGRVVVHIGHEPVATAVDCLDNPLISAGVAHSTASGLDPAGQRRLGDEPVAPDLVEQFGLRDHPLTVTQQICQHIKDLRFHIDDLAGTSKLDALDTQLAITESDPHMCHRASWTARCPNRRAAGQDWRETEILACGQS
jgi:hypothetical protein